MYNDRDTSGRLYSFSPTNTVLLRRIACSGLFIMRLERNKQQYQSFVGVISNLELVSYFSLKCH